MNREARSGEGERAELDAGMRSFSVGKGRVAEAVFGGESGFAVGRVRFGRAAGGEEAVTDVEQFGAGSFYG